MDWTPKGKRKAGKFKNTFHRHRHSTLKTRLEEYPNELARINDPVPDGSVIDNLGECLMLLNRVENAVFPLKLVSQHATLTPAEKLLSLHFYG